MVAVIWVEYEIAFAGQGVGERSCIRQGLVSRRCYIPMHDDDYRERPIGNWQIHESVNFDAITDIRDEKADEVFVLFQDTFNFYLALAIGT